MPPAYVGGTPVGTSRAKDRVNGALVGNLIQPVGDFNADIVSLTGSGVSSWPDQSSLAQHLSQAAAVKQPTLATRAAVQCVSFDGLLTQADGDTIGRAATFVFPTGGFELIVVAAPRAISDYATLVAYNPPGGATAINLRQLSTLGRMQATMTEPAGSGGSNNSVNHTHVFTAGQMYCHDIHYTTATGVLSYQIDNGTPETSTGTGIIDITSPGGFFVGSNNDAQAWGNYDVRRVLLFNRVLTAAERLSWKQSAVAGVTPAIPV